MAKGNFIDYIVSDDPNKYPSDGLHTDGYWYEKVSEGIAPEMFGCTKMAVDTYTPTSNITTNSTLSHSLGEKPKIVMILGDIGDSTSTGATSLVFTSTMTNGNYPPSSYRHCLSVALSYYNVSSSFPSKYALINNDYSPFISAATENSLTYTANYSSSYPHFLLAGVKYSIVTMA